MSLLQTDFQCRHDLFDASGEHRTNLSGLKLFVFDHRDHEIGVTVQLDNDTRHLAGCKYVASHFTTPMV